MSVSQFIKTQIEKTVLINILIIFLSTVYGILLENVIVSIVSIILLLISFHSHEFVHFYFAKRFKFKNIRSNPNSNNLGIIYNITLSEEHILYKVAITSLSAIFLNLFSVIFSGLLIYYRVYLEMIWILCIAVNVYVLISALLAKDDVRSVVILYQELHTIGRGEIHTKKV